MIKILFGGDFVSNDPTVKFSDELLDVFSQCNILGCNFEAPVYSKGQAIKKGGPNLQQSQKSARILEDTGFNVISLSNNHIFDYGEQGYIETKKAFQTATLVGAGSFEDAYSIKKMRVDGKVVGFMALSHYEYGIIEDNNNNLGCAWINHPIVNKIIADAKNEVDFLFILPHAGIENIDAPLPEWRQRYKELIDCGADCIIASHPHVPQGWEAYDGKPIFYSLGNFHFEYEKSIGKFWHKGLLAEVTIDDNNNISFGVKNIKSDNNTICIDNSEEIKEHNRYLVDLISNNSKYIDYINNISLTLLEDYKYSLSLGCKSISLKGFRKMLGTIYMFTRKKDYSASLLNLFRCESHRFIICRALNLKVSSKL